MTDAERQLLHERAAWAKAYNEMATQRQALAQANYALVQQAKQERDALAAELADWKRRAGALMAEETTTQVVLALLLALKKIVQADNRVEAVLIAEEALDRHAPGWRKRDGGRGALDG